MKDTEIVLTLLKKRGMSQRKLAKATNSAHATINRQLNSKNSLKIDDFAIMLDALGYEMRIIPKEGKRPGLAPGDQHALVNDLENPNAVL